MNIRPFQFLLVVFIAASLGACATKPPVEEVEARAEYERINDPLEPLNRFTFKVNGFFDKLLFRPLAKGYNFIIPRPVRGAVTNFLDNLNTPLILLNDLLQGEGKRAKTTFSRFIVNSTVGIGGLFDPAENWGMERHNEDFGQTAAVWGVGEGFYLVLPLFGPSNPRDAAGIVGEFFADPLSIALDKWDREPLSYARTSLELLDFRARNDDVFDELYRAEDPYVTARSAYRQRRAFEISNGRQTESEEEEDLFDEDFEDEPEGAAPLSPITLDLEPIYLDLLAPARK